MKRFEVNMFTLLALLLVVRCAAEVPPDYSALPPEIAKCCFDDRAKECKTIDAAAGYKGHYYTWFGEYYAKTGIDSEGRPVGIKGFPKKIVGTGTDNWFKPGETRYPITSALNRVQCLYIIINGEKYCFEIVNDVISRVGAKTSFYAKKTITACMTTMFDFNDKWLWYWERLQDNSWWLRIWGTQSYIRDKSVAENMVPQAVAGLPDGDKFKGLFFARNGFVYHFVLTDDQKDLNEDELIKKTGFKASLFMGCAKEAVSVSTVGTTVTTTGNASDGSGSTKETEVQSKVLLVALIFAAIFVLILLVGGITLGVLYVKNKKVESRRPDRRTPVSRGNNRINRNNK